MKKYRIVYNEERCWYYDVKADNKAEAIIKADSVYYKGCTEKNVKFLATKPEANSLINCNEVKE